MIFVGHGGGVVTEYDWRRVRGLLPMGTQFLVAGSDGLRVVEGNDDDGRPIQARYRSGMHDCATRRRKSPEAVLLTGTDHGPVSPHIKVDDGSEYPARVVTPAGHATTRGKTGRGAGFTDIQIGFESNAVLEFSSAAVEHDTTRRTGR